MTATDHQREVFMRVFCHRRIRVSSDRPLFLSSSTQVTRSSGLPRSESSAHIVEASGGACAPGVIWRTSRACAVVLHLPRELIHLAFNHDFTDYSGAAETDRRAIEALGEALAESGPPVRRHVWTCRVLTGPHLDRGTTWSTPDSLRASERAALEFTSRGRCGVSVMRLPPSVHGEGDHGFVPRLNRHRAREGASRAYPGDGSNRWPAVHRLDCRPPVFGWRLSRHPRAHALQRDRRRRRPCPWTSQAPIGRHLTLPVTGGSAGNGVRPLRMARRLLPRWTSRRRASSPEELLGWQPTQPGLLDDLVQGHYFHDRARRD